MTAEELLRRIRSKGGRVYRMRQGPSVFVLTTDELLAGWLLDKGARSPLKGESYMRSPGVPEWDVWINQIPVEGEQTIWEACSRGG